MTRNSRKASAGKFSAQELIAKKRDGDALEPDEIRGLVDGFTAGRVPDYQMSAFAMAVLLRGMDATETAALTLAMRDSGARADLRKVRIPKVDKHSTGGVGDKVSICLAPLAACCGLAVPMIAGRGLGHTGGTIDKLEAIEGFRADLTLRRFEGLVARHGIALIGQTEAIAPADRKLYALRDVTATVPSIPLITASILSKKLCEDLDALVLDVKVGRGAFMKTEEEARALAQSIVRVGRMAGTDVTAVLTRMDWPLGATVGNALETREAIELLHGRSPDDLLECTLALGAQMLIAGGLSKSAASAERTLRRKLGDGEPRRRLAALIAAQGGDPRVVEEPDRLPRSTCLRALRADSDGFVVDVDALAVAKVAMHLGAGRTQLHQPIDARVGVVLYRKPGDRVTKGDVLAELHMKGSETRAETTAARRALASAFRIAKRRTPIPELVIGVHRARGGRRGSR